MGYATVYAGVVYVDCHPHYNLENDGKTYHAHGKAEDGNDVLGLVLEQVAPSGFEMVENHIFLFFY
jgi:hypothetical protein